MRRAQKKTSDTDLEKYVREHYNIPDPVYTCVECNRTNLIKSDFYHNRIVCKKCACEKSRLYNEQKKKEKEESRFYETEDLTQLKICNKCRNPLPLSSFPKEPAKITGRGSTCHKCKEKHRGSRKFRKSKNIINSSMAKARFRSTVGIHKIDIFDISENHIFFKILKEDEEYDVIKSCIENLHISIGLHKPIIQDLYQEFEDGMILKANIENSVYLSNNFQTEFTRHEAESKFFHSDNYVKVVIDIIINCQTGTKKCFQAVATHLISL